MKGRKQKIPEGSYQRKARAELKGYSGVQTFMWMAENNITSFNISIMLRCNLRNRPVRNRTQGGVRGRIGN